MDGLDPPASSQPKEAWGLWCEEMFGAGGAQFEVWLRDCDHITEEMPMAVA